MPGKVVALYRGGAKVAALKSGDAGTVVLDRTPFYAEAGGQVGDRGELVAAGGTFEVADTQKIQAEVYGHHGTLRTGALKVGADFLRRFFSSSQVWISDPSWENHRQLFEAAGFTVNSYPYYDPETHGLDFTSMLDTLKSLPPRSVAISSSTCKVDTSRRSCRAA